MRMNVSNEREYLKKILELTVQDPSISKEDKLYIVEHVAIKKMMTK